MKLFTLLALVGIATAGPTLAQTKAQYGGYGSSGPNLAQTKAQYGGYGSSGPTLAQTKAQYGGYGSSGPTLAQTKAQYGGYGSTADDLECDGCVFETEITTGEFVSEIIDSIDANGNGAICVQEAKTVVRRVLKLMGYNKNDIKAMVKMVIAEYEMLAVEEIPKDEFVEKLHDMFSDEEMSDECLIRFIYEAAADSTGLVSKRALKKTLRRLGVRMDGRKLGQLLRQLDQDMDMHISEEELNEWIDSCADGDGDCDDGSCDDGSCDDGSCDDGSCDDGSCDDGSCDDGSCDGGEDCCDGGEDCCDGGEDCDCLEEEI